MQKVPPAVRDLLYEKPYFTWWVSDKDSLSLDSVIFAILNYGDFPDVQLLLKKVGINEVRKIFEKQLKSRNNYDKKVMHYFKLYFKKHA